MAILKWSTFTDQRFDCPDIGKDRASYESCPGAMSATNISTIPEELRQEITSYLNYDDAWSLKQTSTLFYRIVEISTIKSFLACRYGPSLAMLEDWEIIPLGFESCHYCKRLLPKEHFDRHQRHKTAARQDSLWFDYTAWDPESHYCLDCGAKNHIYRAGEQIFVGFGDPGCKDEALMLCKRCNTLKEHQYCSGLCRDCEGIVAAGPNRDPWLHEPVLCPPSPASNQEFSVTAKKSMPKEATQPKRKAHEKAKVRSLLTSIKRVSVFFKTPRVIVENVREKEKGKKGDEISRNLVEDSN